MSKKRYLLMLETELHDWAREFGEQHERSISWVVNRAIRNAKNQADEKNRPAKPKQAEPDNLELAFDVFYSAGLVKKSKQAAFKTFKSLVKEFKCNPVEFANLLSADIKNRIAVRQMGIDALHPSTYLNQRRWDDEITNNGQSAQVSRQSAAERIAARNEAKYGGSGLGMAASGGDLRGAVDAGERGAPFYDVVHSLEQTAAIDCEEWYQADN